VDNEVDFYYPGQPDGSEAQLFDGGTMIEKFCDDPADGSPYLGTCVKRHSYSDQRGLSSGDVDFKQAFDARTSFLLTWFCEMVDGVRQCSINEGVAEYTVRAIDEFGRVGFKRSWSANLPKPYEGSIGLPPYMTCDSGCTCKTYPALYWDIDQQQWIEDLEASQCGTQNANLLQSTCDGANEQREETDFFRASDEQIVEALQGKRFFADYMSLTKVAYDSKGDAVPLKLLQIFATLGLYQRKFATWIPACAQPGSATYYNMIDLQNGNIDNTNGKVDWRNTVDYNDVKIPFDDSQPGFDFGNWLVANPQWLQALQRAQTTLDDSCMYLPSYATSLEQYQAQGQAQGARELIAVSVPAASLGPEAEMEQGQRGLEQRFLRRKRRGAGYQGCARYANCGNKGSHSPPGSG